VRGPRAQEDRTGSTFGNHSVVPLITIKSVGKVRVSNLFDLQVRGETVAVHVNYAPIAPFHFLLIRVSKKELPQELYLEAMRSCMKSLI